MVFSCLFPRFSRFDSEEEMKELLALDKREIRSRNERELSEKIRASLNRSSSNARSYTAVPSEEEFNILDIAFPNKPKVYPKISSCSQVEMDSDMMLYCRV